jgi:hypothetical protein
VSEIEKQRVKIVKMMELPKGAKITHAGLMQHHADGTTDIQKITQAGLVARSPEGTAAKGMNIRGNEDLWVEIQANTFRNWVNEHLRDVGMQVSTHTAQLFWLGCCGLTSEVHCLALLNGTRDLIYMRVFQFMR